jgi:hypothetical protein
MAAWSVADVLAGGGAVAGGGVGSAMAEPYRFSTAGAGASEREAFAQGKWVGVERGSRNCRRKSSGAELRWGNCNGSVEEVEEVASVGN